MPLGPRWPFATLSCHRALAELVGSECATEYAIGAVAGHWGNNMRQFLTSAALKARAIIVLSILAGGAEARQLNIPPVFQETEVWCWVAVTEMSLKHYGLPSLNPTGGYQCGIVNTLGGACAVNCGNCVFSAGMMQNLATAMQNYPSRAITVLNRQVRAVAANNIPTALIPPFIHQEINQGHPIIAGISPSDAPGSSFRYPPGISQHVALIVGIEGDGPDAILTVNDPYPFRPHEDPYLRVGATRVEPGRYRIMARSFAIGLNWTNTINMRPGPVRN